MENIILEEATLIEAPLPCRTEAVCVLLNPLPLLLTEEPEGDSTVVAAC